jgi:hypothetical protein
MFYARYFERSYLSMIISAVTYAKNLQRIVDYGACNILTVTSYDLLYG